VNDDCGYVMFSFLVLGMSGIRIRRHRPMLRNFFIQRLQSFLSLSLFYVFNVFLFLFERF